MKRFFSVLLASVMFLSCDLVSASKLTLTYNGEKHEYNGSTYKLMVNDNFIKTPIEPLIFNDYSLVPIREVCEAMGATVKYIDVTKQVFVEYDGTFVRMKIGSSIAYVDNSETTIPGGISPMLISADGINAKTMIPARFVSESLGFDVDFDGDNGIIKITDPTLKETQPVLYDFRYSLYNTNTLKMEIYSDEAITNITPPAMTASNVLYFDVEGAKSTIPTNNKIDKGAVSSLRIGMHETMTRVALDVSNVKKYNVELSKDGKTIMISVTQGAARPAGIITYTPKPSASASAKPSQPASPAAPSSSASPKPSQTPAPTSTPRAITVRKNVPLSEKIVVIDAGHGGTDPGAIGSLTVGEGDDEKTVQYNEKDLTLSIAKKVRDILKKNGINVIMTREKDTYPTLNERAELANKKEAVIFTSIHINSATNDTAVGYEVYYNLKNNDDLTGLSSKELAESVRDSLKENIDTRCRGVKTANHLVTRVSVMPAILVEVGFISNQEELSLMLTNDFQDAFAQGVAEGIIKVISKADPPVIQTID